MTTLREHLGDWVDIDVAEHDLAQCLGIMPSNSQMSDPRWKWVYWIDNRFGNFFVRTLDQLVELGILEKRDEPDFQYRWSPKSQMPREVEELGPPSHNPPTKF